MLFPVSACFLKDGKFILNINTSYFTIGTRRSRKIAYFLKTLRKIEINYYVIKKLLIMMNLVKYFQCYLTNKNSC